MYMLAYVVNRCDHCGNSGPAVEFGLGMSAKRLVFCRLCLDDVISWAVQGAVGLEKIAEQSNTKRGGNGWKQGLADLG